ncbi:MAG: hypothetical protein M1832_002047 [Thelocarpon impressellum]|nr:MAG: hypothetical protein M1832_002047 [Thelocarpon impressellum]
MSSNPPGFAFPPPPPPPPKAAAPSLVYQAAPQTYVQPQAYPARGHNDRGHRGRGRGDGFRGSRAGNGGPRGHAARPAQALNGQYGATPPTNPPSYSYPNAGYFPPSGYPQAGPQVDQAQAAWGQAQQYSQPQPQPASSQPYFPQPAAAQAPQQQLQQQPYAPQHYYPTPSAPLSQAPGPRQAYDHSFPAPVVPVPPYSAEPPRPPYHNGYGSGSPPSAQSPPPPQQPPLHGQAPAPLMGPPIRMGFDDRHPVNVHPRRGAHLPLRQSSPPFPPRGGQAVHGADNRSFGLRGAYNPNDNPNPYPGRGHGSRGHEQRRHGGTRPRGHHDRPRKAENTGPRPKAAPAVPSFLSTTLPPKPPSTENEEGHGRKKKKQKKKRKHNALGLTPRTEEHEESEEEDVDEEAALAVTIGGEENSLKFAHNGQTMLLSTPSEISAWVEERKKQFPTKQRIEAKNAEKDLRWKQARERGKQALQKEKSKQKKEKQAQQVEQHAEVKEEQAAEPEAKKGEAAGPELATELARKKRERVRKRLKEQERKLARLDAELAKADGVDAAGAESKGTKRKREDGDKDEESVKEEEMPDAGEDGQTKVKLENVKVEGSTLTLDEMIAEASTTTDGRVAAQPSSSDLEKDESMSLSSGSLSMSDDSDDETSSSGSSSASNEGPEEGTTRRAGPERVPPPKREVPICRKFLATGQCRFEGRRGVCRYRHELPNHVLGQPAATAGPRGKKEGKGKTKRKGLYQRMKEKEQEQEDLLVLHAIKHLGDHGLLKDPEEDAGLETLGVIVNGE